MDKNQQNKSIKSQKNLLAYLAAAAVIVLAAFYYVNYSPSPQTPAELMTQEKNADPAQSISVSAIETGMIKKGEYDKVISDKKYKALKDFYPNDFDKPIPGKENPFTP